MPRRTVDLTEGHYVAAPHLEKLVSMAFGKEMPHSARTGSKIASDLKKMVSKAHHKKLDEIIKKRAEKHDKHKSEKPKKATQHKKAEAVKHSPFDKIGRVPPVRFFLEDFAKLGKPDIKQVLGVDNFRCDLLEADIDEYKMIWPVAVDKLAESCVPVDAATGVNATRLKLVWYALSGILDHVKTELSSQEIITGQGHIRTAFNLLVSSDSTRRSVIRGECDKMLDRMNKSRPRNVDVYVQESCKVDKDIKKTIGIDYLLSDDNIQDTTIATMKDIVIKKAEAAQNLLFKLAQTSLDAKCMQCKTARSLTSSYTNVPSYMQNFAGDKKEWEASARLAGAWIDQAVVNTEIKLIIRWVNAISNLLAIMGNITQVDPKFLINELHLMVQSVVNGDSVTVQAADNVRTEFKSKFERTFGPFKKADIIRKNWNMGALLNSHVEFKGKGGVHHKWTFAQALDSGELTSRAMSASMRQTMLSTFWDAKLLSHNSDPDKQMKPLKVFKERSVEPLTKNGKILNKVAHVFEMNIHDCLLTEMADEKYRVMLYFDVLVDVLFLRTSWYGKGVGNTASDAFKNYSSMVTFQCQEKDVKFASEFLALKDLLLGKEAPFAATSENRTYIAPTYLQYRIGHRDADFEVPAVTPSDEGSKEPENGQGGSGGLGGSKEKRPGDPPVDPDADPDAMKVDDDGTEPRNASRPRTCAYPPGQGPYN